MRTWWVIAGLICRLGPAGWAQPVSWHAVQQVPVPGIPVRFAAAVPIKGLLVVFAWGHALLAWRSDTQSWEKLLDGLQNPEAGCAGDPDQDGKPDLAWLEKTGPGGRGQLLWLAGPRFVPTVVDAEEEFADCLLTRLHGVPGVLLVHRYGQLRFYSHPRWPKRIYQELYSFYSLSRQGGLLEADVDEDGYVDLLCGNYWVRNPGRPGLPWRLYALHLWNDHPYGAVLALAAERDSEGRLVSVFAGQRAVNPARLARLRKPALPEKLWTPQHLADETPLRPVRSLLWLRPPGLPPQLIVAEDGGAESRLWVAAAPDYQLCLLDTSPGYLGVWQIPFSHGRSFVALSRSALTLWELQPRK